MKPLRLAWLRMTGCSGCQLSLLNAEPLLVEAAPHLDLVAFPMVSSRFDATDRLDAALVEGGISTPEELQALLALRRRVPLLVAVGACALTGGVPGLAGDHRGERFAHVYGEEKSCASFPPQPLSSFVKVDLEVPGCPPEPAELLESLCALAQQALPELPAYPVCFECRRAEHPCLLFETSPRNACLGPLTRAGCGARCPALGIGCEGCRGRVAGPRTDALREVLREMGVPAPQVAALERRFGKGGA